MRFVERACLAVAALALAGVAVGVVANEPVVWRSAAVACAVAFAIGLGAVTGLRTYRFTAWVIAAVVTGVLLPVVFQPFETEDPRYKIVLLVMIQAVMFGMGTQMSLKDFAGVARSPWPVAVGLVCQFTIMPLVGFSLAVLFRLPPEIGAGMVLIGSCSSGLSSNVLVYIGRANLALSITLTAVATLLAPIVTPFWMTTLGGRLLEGTSVDLDFVDMMVTIIKIVIVPTGAAMIHDYLKHASPAGRRVVGSTAALGAALIAAHAVHAAPGVTAFPSSLSQRDALLLEVGAFVLGGVLFGALYHAATLRLTWLDRTMPAVAMFGIIYVTGMTTAEGRDALMVVGVALFLAAALHNVLGCLLGYWMSRALGMDRLSARTVAFEVGLQNGGMATGIAGDMNKLGTLGLAAAIFIPWMNISGSMLANFWRNRPPTESVTIDST